MRVQLIYNPHATTTDASVRDEVVAAFAGTCDLTVTPTKQRGHAVHLAASAVHDEFSAVISLGGDGTLNEVVQAMAGSDVALGVLPGGSTNVFARSLGLPNDAVAAADVLASALRGGRTEMASLGQAGPRYFTFQAGFGFDAAVVTAVEEHENLKRRFGQAAFVYLGLREWARGADRSAPSIHTADMEPPAPDGGPYAIMIVGNTDPYTYLGSLPMRATPRASLTTGLDVLAIRPPSTARMLGTIGRVFAGATHLNGPHVDYFHDQQSLTLRSERPQPLMVDGDYAGDHLEVTLRAVPDALRILR